MKFIKHIEIIGRYTAASSLSFGTVLILWYYCFPKYELITIIGSYYVVTAFYVNIIVFSIVFSAALIYSRYKNKLFKVIGMLLINIPIAILYLILVIMTINF